MNRAHTKFGNDHTSRGRGRRSHGFSLIEVMVAILVLSIGLLGMAGLLSVSLGNTQNAHFRTQATNLATAALDMLRANVSNVGRYGSDDFVIGEDCTEPAPPPCEADQAAHTCDLARWRHAVCNALPGGRGRIILTSAATSNPAIRAVNARVEICWVDDRSLFEGDLADPSEDCDEDGELILGMESTL